MIACPPRTNWSTWSGGLLSMLICGAVLALGSCTGKSSATYTRPDAGPGGIGPGGDGGPGLDTGTPGGPTTPSCVDHLKNGTETDTDCGGAGTCDRCANGKMCAVGGDCAGSVCTGGVCQSLGCANLMKDGMETDVDCGGPDCGPCGQGKSCRVVADCASRTCTGGTCETPSCTDRMTNGTETDVDCGGAQCAPCPPQGGCAIGRDCGSGVCTAGICAVATCADTVKNESETGVDCGGTCPACPSGQPCVLPGDCLDGVCTNGLCGTGSCTDMVQNGSESDVDCGGSCTTKCAIGKYCLMNTDCAGGVCTTGICQSAGCGDKVKNGMESDVDCGGADCGACEDGKVCSTGADCISAICTGGLCATPSCTDATKNSAETDIDCGGPCTGCPSGKKCKTGGDCASLVCTAGLCAAISCTDMVKNGTEADVDCGGPNAACPKCGPGKTCTLGFDCLSTNCMGGVCQAPSCTDGTKNGTETDMDCGGPSCPACPDGKACGAGTDCTNGVCPTATHVCSAPSCTDGSKNGTETDTDCGGTCSAAPTNKKCADGKMCGGGGDCTSGVCGAGGTCTAPSCADMIANGAETDVDCGGALCTAAGTNKTCADGKKCGTSGANCQSGVCTGGACQPVSCTDLVKNGAETDTDCGGTTCGKCANGKMCGTGTTSGGNCQSGVCTNGACAAPTCADNVKNGAETDTDCGGAMCTAAGTNKKCTDGKGCSVAGDCTSGVCSMGLCVQAMCTDMTKNGAETDTDCGGAMCSPCANGKMCGTSGANCQSGVCTGGACAVPTCADNVKNSDETAVDCGGTCAASPTNKKCADGLACKVAADCASGVCGSNGMCSPSSCTDMVKNGAETDTDCGGAACIVAPNNKKCADGKMCGTGTGTGANCTSGVCTGGLCIAPTCGDTVKNGLESGVDCGGGGTPACPRCPTGQPCGTGSDCVSGSCVASLCAAPSCTDGIKNGVETGTDCGGGGTPACPRCAAGVACAANTDCSAPLFCPTATKVCTAPSCSDVLKNGSETDVDCGGSCAPAQTCANGKACAVNGDCTSANCAAMVCSALGCQTCWKVQYQNSDAGNAQWTDQIVNIVSIGSTAVPLSTLKVRYWFNVNDPSTTAQTPTAPPSCFSAQSAVGGCTNVTMQFVTVTPARPKATHYLEIGFVAAAPTLAAGAQTLGIQTAFHYNNFPTLDRTNDYSFDATKTTLTDWKNVTLYQNGNLVWGTEP